MYIDKINDMTNQDLFLVFALLSAVGVSAVAAIILDYKSKVKRIQSEIDEYWRNEEVPALEVLRRIESILKGGL